MWNGELNVSSSPVTSHTWRSAVPSRGTLLTHTLCCTAGSPLEMTMQSPLCARKPGKSINPDSPLNSSQNIRKAFAFFFLTWKSITAHFLTCKINSKFCAWLLTVGLRKMNYLVISQMLSFSLAETLTQKEAVLVFNGKWCGQHIHRTVAHIQCSFDQKLMTDMNINSQIFNKVFQTAVASSHFHKGEVKF